MKKYLLLIISMLCAVTGAWAGVTLSDSNPYMVLTTTTAGDIYTGFDAIQWFGHSNERIGLKIVGPINQDDIDKLASFAVTLSTEDGIIDFCGATFEGNPTINTVSSKFKVMRVPVSYSLEDNSIPATVDFAFSTDATRQRYWDGDNEENEVINLSVNTGGLTKARTILNGSTYGFENFLRWRKVNLISGNYTSAELTAFSAKFKDAGDQPVVTIISNEPYEVSGCAVTINMAKAEEGQTLADLIALAKDAVIAGGESGICSLIVKGELTNNDLIALGGANMTGATRIDLSDITMGTGVTIDNIQLPASLTSLILPKGLTVSVGLKSKLTAATNLKYAYSPSTGTTGVSPDPDTETISIADYVWVNLAEGLDLALTNEATLNNSKYVKVASDVALSATDITFNTAGRLPNVKYFDMRNANMDASLAAASFKSPTSTEYRIILPDNWSTEQISAFASHLGDVFWTMAAIYSYSGTTLKIYEATDTKYMSDALSNHRIVVDGTTAIEVVGPTLGTQLLAALNGADSDVKTITISASTINNLTFDNDNITTLNVTGLNLNTAELNVDGCAALKNLNVTGSTISSVDASATSLEAVNLNGSTISNNVDLYGSGLKTLTTNSETWIKGNLHLESTASFTSFASTAKFGVNNATNGNIYLNASGVTTVDLQSVQFQNESSKIHIDSNVGEGDTPLTNLNADGKLTIYIPTGFDRTRLHPYSSETLDDNIAELAPSSKFEDTCEPHHCKIDYNAETHVAKVYCYTPGHFKALMENDNNYGKFVDGAIFTFDASCKLNAEDLAALAGKEGYGNFNWNYVDLYNLPASYEYESKTYKYDDIITEAIGILRAKNWQYKGLLLPKAVTTLGTTLIQDRTEDTKKLATCSQFIAYSGAIGTSALTAAYIYKAADDWGITHAERLGKMKEVMDLHSEIMSTTTNWSVSTNSPTPIDISILPTSVTIEGNTVNTSKLETVNNDMVAGTGIPSIYAYPAYENVMYTVATSTGIGNTPNLEILKVTGPVNATDIASVNQFTKGPRVLDLSATTGGITKAMLESITNAKIEYIILPAGMTKEDVCEANYKDALKNENGKLKAVISSTSTNLVAYVNTPGSLAEARYLATGGTVDANTGLITPTQTGMQSVTLAGKLNAADIAANTAGKKVDNDGHWGNGSGNASSIALSSEQGTVTKIDLEDAVFPQYTDMNFSYAGLASISDVTLPTSDSMNKIPADCFRGITSFNEIFIPYNYEYIENAAFYLAEVSHITTADANGGLIDNGENTFTFSKNLKEIGQAPDPLLTDGKPTPMAEPVFFSYAIHNLTAVYVLRTGYEDETFSPTKCYRGAFGSGPTYGWNGFDGGAVYCREKYMNGDQLFTILNYPDKASISNDTDGSKYTAMEKCYTDPTKVYTKKDQTGALDANGEPIPWPTHMELGRSYNQAIRGVTWDAWDHSDKEGYMTSQGNPPGGVVNFDVTEFPAGVTEQDDTKTYSAEYTGWHEFVLSKATYVAPDETVKKDIVYREYEQDGWYTFCIPFDMTRQQVIELMGVPASTDGVKTTTGTFTFDTEGNMTGGTVNDTDILPDIRTLKNVQRTEGSTGIVNLQLSENLNGGRYLKIDLENEANSKYENNDGDIVIRGGYPYIIKPYKQKGDAFTNLGRTILARYDFPMSQSVVETKREDTYIEIGGEVTGKPSKFAKPFTNHKIQAYCMNEGKQGYMTYDDGAGKQKYYYTFIGQFWRQPLPLNSYYMVSHIWYYYKDYTAGYYWSPYKCIITVATKQLGDGEKESNWADEWKVVIPKEVGKDSENHAVFNESLQLTFSNGRDDSFSTSSAPKMFYFSLGGNTMDGVNDNGTTVIEKLDGEDAIPAAMKVYSLSGQYMGISLNGLPQGIYIVNGKKVVVK